MTKSFILRSVVWCGFLPFGASESKLFLAISERWSRKDFYLTVLFCFVSFVYLFIYTLIWELGL